MPGTTWVAREVWSLVNTTQWLAEFALTWHTTRVCVYMSVYCFFPGLIVLTVENVWRPSNFESAHLIESKSRDYIRCVMCIDLLLGCTHLLDEWNFVSHIVLLFWRGFLWLCLGNIVLIICHLCMFVRCTYVVQMYMFCMCTRQTYMWCTWDIHVLYRCTCVVWEMYLCCMDLPAQKC